MNSLVKARSPSDDPCFAKCTSRRSLFWKSAALLRKGPGRSVVTLAAVNGDSRMLVKDGRGSFRAVAMRALVRSSALACDSAAVVVLDAAASCWPRQMGVLFRLGNVIRRHPFLAQGLAATRRHLGHAARPISAIRNRVTLCWATVPAAHRSAVLRCILLRCL